MQMPKKTEKLSKTCKFISDQSINGYIITTKYKIYTIDDIVTKVVHKEVIDSERKEIIDFYKNEYDSMYKNYNDTYGGYTYNIDVKKNQLILNVSIDYNEYNIKKYIKDNNGIRDYVNKKNQYTLKGITKMYKNSGATCK